MVDGNENFTVATALEVADRLAELEVRWFEEPVPQEAPLAMEAVAAASPVPIAYGEHMFGLAEFVEASRRGHATVLQPDVATCGGLSEGMRIASAAGAAGARLAPHTAAGPVALAANLHFASACPSVHLLEYPSPLAECWATIAPTCPVGPDHVTSGALAPPSGPGLGIQIDLEAVNERPYQPPPPRPEASTRFVGDI